eukprot:Ihof_evm2s656 gene=Ihof_evmTU2s656
MISDPLQFMDVEIDHPFESGSVEEEVDFNGANQNGEEKEIVENETEEGDMETDIAISTASFPTPQLNSPSPLSQKIHLTVSDPILQDYKRLDKHYDFNVESRKSLDGPVINSCRRRYTDFEWLHGMLKERAPELIIPPMPSKTLVTVGTNKLEARRAALEKFLNRIAQHPVLSTLGILNTFMRADQSLFAKKPKKPMTFDMTKQVMAVDEKYVNAMESASLLAKVLDNIDKENQKLSKQRFEMSEGIVHLAQSLESLEMIEGELVQTVGTVRRSMELRAEGLQKSVLSETCTYQNNIRELSAYTQAVMSMLNYRMSVQKKVISFEYQLEKTHTDLDALESGQNKLLLEQFMRRDIDQCKTEKIGQLTTVLSDLVKLKRDAIQTMNTVNATVDQELDWWENFKNQEMKNILHSYANQHLEYIKE